MEPLPQTEPDFEAALLQARDALLQSRYPDAEQLAAACVRQQPGNREALYALAVHAVFAVPLSVSSARVGAPVMLVVEVVAVAAASFATVTTYHVGLALASEVSCAW